MWTQNLDNHSKINDVRAEHSISVPRDRRHTAYSGTTSSPCATAETCRLAGGGCLNRVCHSSASWRGTIRRFQSFLEAVQKAVQHSSCCAWTNQAPFQSR